ncbi:MAG: AmmeMemoRadiSam system radical SAM enzyme [Chitinivibrionales bacterium]|nr:AmmeMemoRadiSam system radical SAM enzyme [Chitinivibrionales bacterium]
MPTTEAMLYDKQPDGSVQCYLCAHRCRIKPGRYGYCCVRENIDGTLHTHTFGRLIAQNVDPIEKKPLYHVLPGSTSYSVATIGCNFRCDFCQNWQISQIHGSGGPPRRGVAMSPEEIAVDAAESGCRSIAYTYTEPTIFFEYAYETARAAHERGLLNVFVTNGYMTGEALETIRPYLDACNVDLKSFRDEFYRTRCGARLEPVLESIKRMRELDIWVEVTTLVIPGQNDSREELDSIAGFLAETDPRIPWHISRFHPQYKLTEAASTPLETLHMARDLGIAHGLRYVYLGNVAGSIETLCPECKAVLVRRSGFSARVLGLHDGQCESCRTAIDGIWG